MQIKIGRLKLEVDDILFVLGNTLKKEPKTAVGLSSSKNVKILDVDSKKIIEEIEKTSGKKLVRFKNSLGNNTGPYVFENQLNEFSSLHELFSTPIEENSNRKNGFWLCEKNGVKRFFTFSDPDLGEQEVYEINFAPISDDSNPNPNQEEDQL